MKIVYFVNAAWYFELHWLDRSEAAISDGYEVHLISNFSDSTIKKKLEQKGIKCWNIKLNRFSINFLKNILIFFSFRKICKKIKPDVIHLITIKPILFGGLYARLAGIPFIVSFVGLGRLFGEKKRGVFNSFIFNSVLLVYRLLLSPSSPVQVVFEHNGDFTELSKYITFNRNNVHIIEGAGIDRLRFSYHPEPLKESFSILFASRLLWSKGLGEVVEAVENLKKNKNDITLYVAGIIDDKDPDRIKLNQILEWDYQKKIVWLGKRNDMQEVIKNSHIIILPTKYSEGIPRIIIEACAIGRSCIVGNVPGCKAIIRDNFNGCVLKTYNPNEIAEKIKFLKDNGEIRKEFGLRSTGIVKERFSKEIIINKTLCVYNELLGAKKR